MSRQKIEIPHPTWRGGGFQCGSCKKEHGSPSAHRDDGLLYCESCREWREMNEVRYVALVPTLAAKDLETMEVVWDQRNQPSGSNTNRPRRLACYRDAAGAEWVVDHASLQFRGVHHARDEWHPLG